MRFIVDHQPYQVTKIEESTGNRGDEDIKMDDIFLADAFAEPGTVVVVLFHAYVAVFAMIDASRCEYFADVTVTEYM